MGKKKVLSERDLKQMVYPSENDVLCVVQKMLGYDRGLVSPWDFQTEDRGEIFWRYTRNQVEQMRKEDILKIE